MLSFHVQRPKSIHKLSCMLVAFCLLVPITGSLPAEPRAKYKIFIVSSYHREYLWSQETNKGVCAALVELGYLDNKAQAEQFTKNDYVKTARTEIKKVWMDTKRKSEKGEIAKSTQRICKAINAFKPNILLLGDDNAANYIGNVYLDEKLPVVFWGINGIPLKYGLIDEIEKPGHNVTGIYQAGYLIESLQYLKKIVPSIRRFAVLSDDSPTGRSKAKELKNYQSRGKLPLELVEIVITNSFAEWKSKALDLQKRVDAFFVLNHNTIKDSRGRVVDQMEIGKWYLRNIKKPECAHEKQFSVEGMLCVVDDSGFKQGYEAIKVAHGILKEGKNVGDMPVRAPERGPIIVNRERAKMLKIKLTSDMGIEEYIDECLALRK